MRGDVDKIRSEIVSLKNKLSQKEAELQRVISTCCHDWSKPIADHIYQKGYTIEGDPPGTMGIDWCGPTHVEAKTIPRWMRQCKHCGEIQHTTQAEQHVTHTPKF